MICSSTSTAIVGKIEGSSILFLTGRGTLCFWRPLSRALNAHVRTVRKYSLSAMRLAWSHFLHLFQNFFMILKTSLRSCPTMQTKCTYMDIFVKSKYVQISCWRTRNKQNKFGMFAAAFTTISQP